MGNDEGFIQTKQRELNEKLLATEQKTVILERRIEIANNTIENYEQLIATLKKQEEFNRDLQKNNEKIIKQITDDYHKKINDVIEVILRKKAKQWENEVHDISDTLNRIVEDYNSKLKIADKSTSINSFIIHLLGHLLIKKNIISITDFQRLIQLKIRFQKLSDMDFNKSKGKSELKLFLKEVFGDLFEYQEELNK